jgi:hypothetical protein
MLSRFYNNFVRFISFVVFYGLQVSSNSCVLVYCIGIHLMMAHEAETCSEVTCVHIHVRKWLRRRQLLLFLSPILCYINNVVNSAVGNRARRSWKRYTPDHIYDIFFVKPHQITNYIIP